MTDTTGKLTLIGGLPLSGFSAGANETRCLSCWREAPLMPVDVVLLGGCLPGGGRRWRMCAACRMSWRDDAASVLLSTFLHSPHAELRWYAMAARRELDARQEEPHGPS